MSSATPLIGPLFGAFSLRKAIHCANLVNVAYDLYQQWSDARKPPEAEMRFKPVACGTLAFSAPFWRTLTYRKSPPAGPKNTARRFETIAERTPAGVCARRDNTLFVIFRGTQSAGEKITNWMVDKQDAVFDDLKGGNVHRGFHRCYESVRDSVMDFLKVHAGPDRSIRVTGHSLGGALATLAAMDIATCGRPYRALEVFTFASPLVGAARWARHYEEQRAATWRIANRRDLVTKVPPSLLGYRAVGIPLLFSSPDGIPPHSLTEAYLPALRATGCGGPPLRQ
jgi:triacylglycerol lipase